MNFGLSFKSWRGLVLGGSLALSSLFWQSSAQAQINYAAKQRTASATAHYARARAMCVETLEEFEAGRKYARPDLLLDAEEWRLTLISLCEQLNRVVDPKLRVSLQGVQVGANPRLIRRVRDRLPEVSDGPQERSDAGEIARLKEKQEARAKLYRKGAAGAGKREAEEAEEADAPAAEETGEELSAEEASAEEAERAVKAPAIAKKPKSAAIAVSPKGQALEQPTETDVSREIEAEEEQAPAAKKIMPQDTAPQNTRQEDTAQEDTVQEETAPEDSAQDAAELQPLGEEEGAELEDGQTQAPSADAQSAPQSGIAAEDAQIAAAIEEAIQQKVQNLDQPTAGKGNPAAGSETTQQNSEAGEASAEANAQ